MTDLINLPTLKMKKGSGLKPGGGLITRTIESEVLCRAYLQILWRYLVERPVEVATHRNGEILHCTGSNTRNKFQRPR